MSGFEAKNKPDRNQSRTIERAVKPNSQIVKTVYFEPLQKFKEELSKEILIKLEKLNTSENSKYVI